MHNESHPEAGALPPWLAEPYSLCKLCIPGDIATEHVDVGNAVSRVAAAEVVAEHHVPHIAYSECRGFALRSVDTLGASSAQPAVLTVRSALRLPRVGIAGVPGLRPGVAETICLPAGVPMPAGADAIQPEPPRYVDDAEAVQGDEWKLRLTAPVRAGNGVVAAGADCLSGEVLLGPGERMTAEMQALAIAAGVSSVRVTRRPRLGVLVNSHDLLAPGVPASEHWQRPDSTGVVVRSLLRQWGHDVARVAYLSPVGAKATRDAAPFSREGYVARIRELIACFDLIIACGMPEDPLLSGEGLGDLTGFPFGRTRVDIAQVPASRLSFALSEDRSAATVSTRTVYRPGALLPSTVRVESRDRAVLVNLPGDTATVSVLMHCLVRRVIDLLEGAADPAPHWEWMALDHAIASDTKANRMVWGTVNSHAHAPATFRAASQAGPARLSPMLGATAIAAVGASHERLEPGQCVRVLRL